MARQGNDNGTCDRTELLENNINSLSKQSSETSCQQNTSDSTVSAVLPHLDAISSLSHGFPSTPPRVPQPNLNNPFALPFVPYGLSSTSMFAQPHQNNPYHFPSFTYGLPSSPSAVHPHQNNRFALSSVSHGLAHFNQNNLGALPSFSHSLPGMASVAQPIQSIMNTSSRSAITTSSQTSQVATVLSSHSSTQSKKRTFSNLLTKGSQIHVPYNAECETIALIGHNKVLSK